MDALPIKLVVVQVIEGKKHMFDQLVSESKAGISLMRSEFLPGLSLSNDDIKKMMNYIVMHNDSTAYHLLFALRRQSSQSYHSLPVEIRARILCDALACQTYLNDWGYLEPSGSYDGEAAIALLELGDSAVMPLLPLLEDERVAPLFGSETATLSSTFKYRRKDFAYRYISLIRGIDPAFDPDPAARDLAIEELKSILDQESKARLDQ